MFGLPARTWPAVIGLAACVAASLACGGPLRQPTPLPPPAVQATGAAPTPAPLTEQPASPAASPQPSPTPLAEASVTPPAAAAQPPALVPSLAPSAANPEPDAQSDQIEGLLAQLEATNTAGEAELEEIVAAP
jgi:hypothetical protein